MNLIEKLSIIEEANNRRLEMSNQKGEEYTVLPGTYYDDDVDVLRNFKSVGEALALDPIIVCSVYLRKHIDSIYTFVRKFQGCETLDDRFVLMSQGEGIESRLDDARNYLDLLECLLYEYTVKDEAEWINPDAAEDVRNEFLAAMFKNDDEEWSEEDILYRSPPSTYSSVSTLFEKDL